MYKVRQPPRHSPGWHRNILAWFYIDDIRESLVAPRDFEEKSITVLRTGVYRILYEIDDDERIVTV